MPGAPYPLGATWDGLGVNFAVFSAHAERIELCLFDPSGRREIARFTLPECTDEVWHGYLPDATPACSTAIAPTVPTSRDARPSLQSATSCCSIPMRAQLAGESDAGPTRCSATALQSTRGDLSFDRRDSAPRHAEGAW